jgi:hypothetical protein
LPLTIILTTRYVVGFGGESEGFDLPIVFAVQAGGETKLVNVIEQV